jgi:hypothetical protein
MPIKKNEENNSVFLVVDKEELKRKIKERMELGHDIHKRSITSLVEKETAYADFIDWDNFNEELIRQAFDKPKNIYVDEYKFHEPIDIYAAISNRAVSFQEEVSTEKESIKLQIRKLSWFYEKIDVVKVSDTIRKIEPSKIDFDSLIAMLNRFHKVAQAVRERHSARETIIIKDEYDVQDLLNGLLQIFFDDVRKEEYSPSNSGANTRIDFVLKREKIILEIKMTNESLSLKKLGEELLIDIGRYKEYPNCNDLVIFIYDKGDHIRNKQGFITDLQKQSSPGLKVTVVINPN